MNISKELSELPDALRQMYEEGLPLYDALIRRIGWSERPVYITGDGSSYPAALTGAWAFESLLGMPVIVERPAVFTAYTCRTLRPRSLVIVIAGPHDGKQIIEAATEARKHGAVVWVMTPNPASELPALADAVATDYSVNSGDESSRSILCRHAAMLFLAVAAAQALKAPRKAAGAQEAELAKLAGHVEWVLDQVSDAARALAERFKSLPGLYFTGAGAFYPMALQAADRLRESGLLAAYGFELLAFERSYKHISQPGSGIVYLSSSRCGLKEQVHLSVGQSGQERSRKVFAITDGNDRQLFERADMAILLPILTEAGAALLTLAFLERAASYVVTPARRQAKTS
ncbi:MAG TPA: SIS domain-containing protein [Terriglobia bacterium]|nr:SIS domain-containing protein [Terriglobia bacterium]